MFASPMTTQFYLQSTAPPDYSTFRSRLTTVPFLQSNALAGPLELGVPPKLSLLRLVMSSTLELYSQVYSLVTTVNPTVLLTKDARFTASVVQLPP